MAVEEFLHGQDIKQLLWWYNFTLEEDGSDYDGLSEMTYENVTSAIGEKLVDELMSNEVLREELNIDVNDFQAQDPQKMSDLYQLYREKTQAE